MLATSLLAVLAIMGPALTSSSLLYGLDPNNLDVVSFDVAAPESWTAHCSYSDYGDLYACDVIPDSVTKMAYCSHSSSHSHSVSDSDSDSTSDSESKSVSVSVSESESDSKSKSASVSTSRSVSKSESASTSASTSKSISISGSTSASTSNSDSDSDSDSDSGSESISLSDSQSTSTSQSKSTSTSKSNSASISASTSTSISKSTSISESVSKSESISKSKSTSTSESTSSSATVTTSAGKDASVAVASTASVIPLRRTVKRATKRVVMPDESASNDYTSSLHAIGFLSKKMFKFDAPMTSCKASVLNNVQICDLCYPIAGTWSVSAQKFYVVLLQYFTSPPDLMASILAWVDFSDCWKVTIVGQITNAQQVAAISEGPDGTLYIVDALTDQLIAVNKQTAEGKVIGNLLIDIGYASGMDWDTSTKAMYLAASLADETQELRTVNLQTGATTLVSALPNAIVCMSFQDSYGISTIVEFSLHIAPKWTELPPDFEAQFRADVAAALCVPMESIAVLAVSLSTDEELTDVTVSYTVDITMTDFTCTDDVITQMDIVTDDPDSVLYDGIVTQDVVPDSLTVIQVTINDPSESESQASSSSSQDKFSVSSADTQATPWIIVFIALILLTVSTS